MVQATIINKQGVEEGFSKPCFGFMGYINQWNEDDEVWDEDEDEYINTPLDGFSSDNIETMIYHHGEGGAAFINAVKSAMEKLPQYYDNVTWAEGDDDLVFPLVGVPMQKTIIGAMMMRNIFTYESCRNVFLHLLEAGREPVVAFVLSQRYFSNYHFASGGMAFFTSSDGDESIFGDYSRLCDLRAMLNGEIGYLWQGVWGDTDNGYGRDGEYDDDSSPINPRTGHRSRLTETTQVVDKTVWEESPLLYSFENEFSDTGRMDTVQFSKLVDTVLA